jgi:hypothetical protein
MILKKINSTLLQHFRYSMAPMVSAKIVVAVVARRGGSN